MAELFFSHILTIANYYQLSNELAASHEVAAWGDCEIGCGRLWQDVFSEGYWVDLDLRLLQSMEQQPVTSQTRTPQPSLPDR